MVGKNILEKQKLFEKLRKFDESYMNLINNVREKRMKRFLGKFSPYSNINLSINFKGLHRSYEASKKQFWNDSEILDNLIKKYGPPYLPEREKAAIMHIFSIIYYGEIVAMIVAAQLLEMVDDFDAKKVLAAQVIEEAKHATAYQRYLSYLGELPPIEPHSRFILDDIMKTQNKVLKMIGMQLLVENVAFNLFTAVKQISPDPVLKELLEYIAMDEAKHVGLARKYLPVMMNKISFNEYVFTISKQLQWLFHIIISILKLKSHAEVIGIDVNRWVKLGIKDFLSVAYDIAQRTKFARFTIPKNLVEKFGDFIADKFFISNISKERINLQERVQGI